MSGSPRPAAVRASAPAREVGRARWAVTLAFLTNGALFGALIPHYPEAKAAFGLGAGEFGLLVVSLMLGAVLTGSLPAPILRRVGSRRVVLAGTLALAVLVTLAGLAVDFAAAARADGAAVWDGFVWLFAGLLFVSGLGDAIVDTAQNAQGIRVQTVIGRPVLTSMHAGWSIGAAGGAGLGALAVGAGLPMALHLVLNGAACAAVVLVVHRRFLPDAPDPLPDDGPSPAAEAVASESSSPSEGSAGAPAGPTRARAYLALVPVILVAMAGFGVEEFGNAWTSLFLQTERGLDPAVAGLGASTLLAAQFAGRLAGDRVLAAWGRRRTLTVSLGAVVLGLGAVLLSPAVPVIVAGLVLCGLGCAVVVPTAYALGDEVPGLPPQTGLAVVSWLMRLAGIGLSPLVGLLAVGLPLAVALLVFPVLAAAGLLCTVALRARTLA
ncbi:MFS transporter [Micrococcus luteus]